MITRSQEVEEAMKKTLVALAVLVALPLVALAQKPVTQTEAVEITAKIEAIDKTSRMVTLKDKDGETETIYCGPEVKRFDELKVGDSVTFKYYESTAFAIRKPGQPSGLPKDTDPKLTRGTGPKPSGTIAQQETATVTIKAIDAKVPSVTVLTDDGRTVSFKVDDKKKLEGVAVGDKVEITYTQAFVVTVK
jgi:Cu/Ag efflux protein CusF